MTTLRNSAFARFMAITMGAFLALASFIPAPTHAQPVSTRLDFSLADPVSGISTGDDTDTALLIRYIGTGVNNSGTVEVTAASSDMTFLQGVQGAEAASTEFECPVSGALGGILDVSNAACNTLGEIVDIINDSTSWRAVILDGYRTDVADARLVTMAATRATSVDGLGIKWDTSTAFDYTQALVPPNLRLMSGYLKAPERGPGGVKQPAVNQFTNTQTALLLANATSTYGSGTSALDVRSCKLSDMNSSNSYSEVCTVIYNEPGGATTANKVFDDAVNAGGWFGRRNERLVVRLDNSAAMASVSFRAYGWHWPSGR